MPRGIITEKAKLVFDSENKISPYDVAAKVIEGISMQGE